MTASVRRYKLVIAKTNYSYRKRSTVTENKPVGSGGAKMEVLQEEIYDHTSDSARESFRNQQYQRGSMQRSAIVDRLRREGCRITKQRKIILDIILQEECTCCKEIYFLASKKDPNIGMATIYRMKFSSSSILVIRAWSASSPLYIKVSKSESARTEPSPSAYRPS